MIEHSRPTNLEELLDVMAEASEDSGQVSLGEILNVVGPRSFGPLLLVAGVITQVPIPGLPTFIGLIVALIAVQLLFRRKHLWLPHWMLERSVAEEKLRKAIEWMRRPARWVDRFLRPRLVFLTEGPAIFMIAAICFLIAVAMPIMDFVPFSAIAAGIALIVFGLSLIANDGLLALLAFIFTLVTVGAIGLNLF